jgi:hypothetical protein
MTACLPIVAQPGFVAMRTNEQRSSMGIAKGADRRA